MNVKHIRTMMRPLVLLVLLHVPGARAQFGPLMTSTQTPQAKSADELDAYLEIYKNQDLQATVTLANQFIATYPDSEFLGLVYEHEAQAYQEMNNYEGVVWAGEKALALSPRNIKVLVMLALAIPNGVSGRSDSARLLGQAETYARRALRELDDKKIPQDVSLEEWKDLKGSLESDCHEALGHISVKRGDTAGGIREFRTAAFGNPKPNGRQFLRLSSTYRLAGQYEAAKQAAARAAELGNDQIRQLALQQLQDIRGRSHK